MPRHSNWAEFILKEAPAEMTTGNRCCLHVRRCSRQSNSGCGSYEGDVERLEQEPIVLSSGKNDAHKVPPGKSIHLDEFSASPRSEAHHLFLMGFTSPGLLIH